MEESEVRKYVNKRVNIVLKNNFRYTTVMPSITSNTFQITDKFGKSVTISCDYIGFIAEVDNYD